MTLLIQRISSNVLRTCSLITSPELSAPPQLKTVKICSIELT